MEIDDEIVHKDFGRYDNGLVEKIWNYAQYSGLKEFKGDLNKRKQSNFD